MIPVSEALSRLFALVTPLDREQVDLRQAAGRVLALDATSTLTQPPFAAAIMDGYAVRNGEVHARARWTVVGEAAAGHDYSGTLQPGTAVRIFTGAPMPEGADRVIIQEDVDRDGTVITLRDGFDTAIYVRPKGADFAAGDRIAAPRRLRPSDIALLAAMNVPTVTVFRRPVVAILATGDELVQPGETPGPSQIVASNSYGLAAMVEAEGGIARMLPIARDTASSLRLAFDLAKGADLVLTIGGASVGDYDLVGQVAGDLGMEQSFYKVAMRPGKPLMAGRLGTAAMIGLPGNPVSAMVCGTVFVTPVLRAMQGLPAEPAARTVGVLGHDIGANGPREHYMRARRTPAGLEVFGSQDSALLGVLAAADCLVVRPPKDPARLAGEPVDYIPL